MMKRRYFRGIKEVMRQQALKRYKKNPLRLPIKELKEKEPRLFNVLVSTEAMKEWEEAKRSYVMKEIEIAEYEESEGVSVERKGHSPKNYLGSEFFTMPSYKPLFKTYFKKRREGKDRYESALESLKEEGFPVIRIKWGKEFWEVPVSALTPTTFKKIVKIKKRPTLKELEDIIFQTKKK